MSSVCVWLYLLWFRILRPPALKVKTETKTSTVCVQTNPGRFARGSFRRGSFRPDLGVGRFALIRLIVSPVSRFARGPFPPNYILVR